MLTADQGFNPERLEAYVQGAQDARGQAQVDRRRRSLHRGGAVTKRRTLVEQLKRLNACSEALDWVGNRTLERAWNECEDIEWMLWAAEAVGIDKKVLVSAACDFAATALRFVPQGEDRPRKAIRVTRAWVRGRASIASVGAAGDAARDAAGAAAGDAARYAAGAAARAAARAAAWAAAGDAAGDAARYAARGAAWDAAGAAAWAAAGAAADKRMRRLLRKRVTVPMLRRALRRTMRKRSLAA